MMKLYFKRYKLFRAVIGGMSIRKDDLESQNHYTTEIHSFIQVKSNLKYFSPNIIMEVLMEKY